MTTDILSSSRDLSLPILWTLLLSLSACVETIVVEAEMGGAESNNNGGEMQIDNTSMLVNSALLIRVIPEDTSLGAELFCVGVPVTQRAIITSASCFRGGLRYAEILSGLTVSFSDDRNRLAIVEKAYKHPAFNPDIPADLGSNLVVAHVDRDLNTQTVLPYVGEVNDSLTPLLRVGYLADMELNFQRTVAFGLNPTLEDSIIVFEDGEGSLPLCNVTGAPVLAIVNNQPSLIGVSSWGNESCTEGGSASSLSQQTTIDFLNDALNQTYTVPAGQSASAKGDLSCSQAFKCFNYSGCLAFLGAEASMQYDNLYLCTSAAGCAADDFGCFMESCPEEYSACLGQSQ